MFNFGLIAFNWFLGKLAQKNFQDLDSELVTILILAGTLLASVLGTVFFCTGAYLASTNFFRELIWNILRRPMAFFDSTPVGQILGRLVSDRDSADNDFVYWLQQIINGLIQIAGIFAVIGLSSPLMLVVFAIVLFYFIVSFTRSFALSMKLKKINEMCKGPIYSSISEVFNGASVVKSFQIEEKIKADFELHMDRQLCSEAHLELCDFYNFFKCEQYGALLSTFTAVTICLMRILDLGALMNQERMALALSNVMVISSWVD